MKKVASHSFALIDAELILLVLCVGDVRVHAFIPPIRSN